MQIILLEKIANLGNLGDVVKVKDGYARNFLIPGKHARRATEAAIKEFEARRADLEKAAADKLAAAQALQEQLAGKVVRISQKAGVDGRLFGSVTNADIAEGLTKMGFAIQKSQVRMPNGPLKVTGEHAVSVSPHTDVVVEITVQVVGAGRLSRLVCRLRQKAGHKPAFCICRPGTCVPTACAPAVHRLAHRARPSCPPSSNPAISGPAPRDDEVARLRVPPNSNEAEQSVLGGLLLDNLAWDRAADLLSDSDFYRHEHRLIYAAIGALVNASKPADVITVFEQLQNHGQGAGLRRPGLPERAGAERAQRRQHAALCGDRARARHPAQADRRQRRDRHHRLQPAGPRGVADPRRSRGQDLQDRRGRLAQRARASRASTSW